MLKEKKLSVFHISHLDSLSSFPSVLHNHPSLFVTWNPNALIAVLIHLMADTTVSNDELNIHVFARAWTIVGLHSSQIIIIVQYMVKNKKSKQTGTVPDFETFSRFCPALFFFQFCFTNIYLYQPHKSSIVQALMSAVLFLDGWCLIFSLFWNKSWALSFWFPRYLLVTAGEDRYVKTWDLRRPYNPITALKRCLTNEIYWPLNASGFMLAQDNSYASLVGFSVVSTRITARKVYEDIALTG